MRAVPWFTWLLGLVASGAALAETATPPSTRSRAIEIVLPTTAGPAGAAMAGLARQDSLRLVFFRNEPAEESRVERKGWRFDREWVSELVHRALTLPPAACGEASHELGRFRHDGVALHAAGPVDSFAIAFDFRRACVTFLRLGQVVESRSMDSHEQRMIAVLRRASVADPDLGQLAEALEPAPTHDADPSFGQYVYVEELPEAIEKVAPVYPEAARKRGVEGVVVVQALVGRDGRVHRTKVTKAIPDLDAAAEASVRQWVFKPALSEGKPVPVWVAVPVSFRLK